MEPVLSITTQFWLHMPYVFFDEALDAWTGAGAAIIVGSSVYIAHREAVHDRAVTMPPPRPDSDVVPPPPPANSRSGAD